MGKEITVSLRPVWEADYISASELKLYDCGKEGERYVQALGFLDADEGAIKDYVENNFKSDGDIVFRLFEMGPGTVPRGYKMNLSVRDEQKDKEVHSSILTFNPFDFNLYDRVVGDIRFAEDIPNLLRESILDIVSRVKSGKLSRRLEVAMTHCVTASPYSLYMSGHPEVTLENLFIGVVKHLVLKEVRFRIRLDDGEVFDKKKLYFFPFDWRGLWGVPHLIPAHQYLSNRMSLFLLYDNTLYAGDLACGHDGDGFYGLLKFKTAGDDIGNLYAGFGKPLAAAKKDFVVPEQTFFSVPDTAGAIADQAFEKWANLVSVEIPESVTRIGCAAFSGCKSLSSLVIPDSVNEIGARAFSRCTALKSVVLPQSLAQIQTYTFDECPSLCSVVIPSSVSIIGYGAFAKCTSLTAVTILGPVEKIEMRAFSGCSSLKTISLPVGIKKIDKSAFEGCTAIERIEVPAAKGDYYKKRLPESLHSFIVERPSEKKKN